MSAKFVRVKEYDGNTGRQCAEPGCSRSLVDQGYIWEVDGKQKEVCEMHDTLFRFSLEASTEGD